jgi:uncharacterized repeat protein (TIGR02543 family)
MAVTARMVMIVVLLTGFCAGVKAQVTIMRYLQSKQAFQDSITAGAIEIKHGKSDGSSGSGTVVTSSSLCYWDDTKDALRVTGGSQSGAEVNVANPNGIALTTSGTHGPFKLVNTSTGFTLSMEAWINRSRSSADMARFFDATKYLSGNEGNINKRSHLFGFKPLSEICFYEWTDGSTPKYSGIISDTSLGQDGKWANYLILVSSTGNVKVYIDGVLKHNRSDIVNAVKSVLGSIKGFNLTIGNAPSWEKNKQLDGWIRNVQIVSSTDLTKVKLNGYNTTTTDWTKTLFTNSLNISQQPLTVVGSTVVLTPHEGYYVDWSKVSLSGASWADSSNPGSFTMPNSDVTVTVATDAISMKQFGVHYDANNGTGAPGNSSSVNYWTNTTANTLNTLSLSSTTPTREGYSFTGWNTKQDGSGNTFLASASVNAQQLGVTGNSQQNVVTLYAQWTKVNYTVTNAQFVVQDYNGNIISTPAGLSLELKRALEATPETFDPISSDGTAQINDKIQVTNTSTNQDYFLYSLTYTPAGGSASGDIKDNPTFTMPAANVTITATFRKYQEFDLTAAGVSGTGNAISFLVKHRDSEFTASTKAMQTDQVKVHATVGSGFVLRTVTYQFDGVDGTTNIYNGKGTGTFDIPTTFEMLTHPVTVTATFLQDRAVSVGGHTERGTITMTGKYGTSSGDVTTAATSANASLAAHLGDEVTVTATPAIGWHFDTAQDVTSLFTLTSTPTVTAAATTTALSKTKAEVKFTMPDAAVEVAGLFTENCYLISYDANGGSGAPDGTTKKHFESLTLSNVEPTKDNMTFLGWARSNTATVAEYAAGATVGSELNPTTTDGSSPDGQTVTLYAVWKSTEYTVAVDPGINGGKVSVDKTSAVAGSTINISFTAYEGYSDPTFYYYTIGGAEKKESGALSGSSFTMPSKNIYVYAVFAGENKARLDESSPALVNHEIVHGTISVGDQTLTQSSLLEIGSIVNTVAKPDDAYRLKEITWQRMTSGDMKTRTRAAGDTDVEVSGIHTLTYDPANPTNVTYNKENGEYVAVIEGLTGDIYMAGSFQSKVSLQKDNSSADGYVTLTGPDEQQYNNGAAVIPVSGTYTVKFSGVPQTEGADYTISWSDNINPADVPKATITATRNNEMYTGSVVIDNAFTIVKAPEDGIYTSSYSTDFTYDGLPKTLTDLVVYYQTDASADKTTLTVGDSGEGKYSVDYINNTNAGTATAKITIHGTSGDLGTLICNYNIKPRPVTITADPQSVAYGDGISTTGSLATCSALTGIATSGLLSGHSLASASFAMTVSKPAVGTYATGIEMSSAKIQDGGGNDMTANYDVTYATGQLTVTAKTLTVKALTPSIEYGDAVPTVTNSWYAVTGLAYGETLTQVPTGYTVGGAALTQGKAVGTYPLSLFGATASDNYTINYEAGTMTITQYDLSKAAVEVTGGTQPYDGSAKTATSVAVKKHIEGDTYWTLPAADYTVKYGGASSQTESGTYTITVEASGTNVTRTATAETPLVIGKYDLAGDKVTAAIADQTYTGSQIRPTAFSTLKMDGADMSTDDYEIISYGQNINVGTDAGTLTIRAKETSTKFTGDRVVTFNIVTADLSAASAVTSVTWSDVVLSDNNSDTHMLKFADEAPHKKVTTSFNGAALSLASASLKVRLANGTNDLSPDDYDVYFQKNSEEPIASIPADAIGLYKVVVMGKANVATATTNTTDYYVATGLTVNVTLTTTLPNSTWVTYYDERFSLKTPEGFNAYYVTGITEASGSNPATVNTSSAMDYIPVGVPVLLERTTGTGTTFELEEETTNTTISGTKYDQFIGVPSTGVMPAGVPTYILMNNAFVGCETGTDIGAHRAFLTTPAVVGARLLLNIGDDATALIPTEDVGGKTEDVWYDLMGNRINKPTRKGLYIRNGEKVIVK